MVETRIMMQICLKAIWYRSVLRIFLTESVFVSISPCSCRHYCYNLVLVMILVVILSSSSLVSSRSCHRHCRSCLVFILITNILVTASFLSSSSLSSPHTSHYHCYRLVLIVIIVFFSPCFCHHCCYHLVLVLNIVVILSFLSSTMFLSQHSINIVSSHSPLCPHLLPQHYWPFYFPHLSALWKQYSHALSSLYHLWLQQFFFFHFLFEHNSSHLNIGVDFILPAFQSIRLIASRFSSFFYSRLSVTLSHSITT